MRNRLTPTDTYNALCRGFNVDPSEHHLFILGEQQASNLCIIDGTGRLSKVKMMFNCKQPYMDGLDEPIRGVNDD